LTLKKKYFCDCIVHTPPHFYIHQKKTCSPKRGLKFGPCEYLRETVLWKIHFYKTQKTLYDVSGRKLKAPNPPPSTSRRPAPIHGHCLVAEGAPRARSLPRRPACPSPARVAEEPLFPADRAILQTQANFHTLLLIESIFCFAAFCRLSLLLRKDVLFPKHAGSDRWHQSATKRQEKQSAARH